jgi:hypothetical protein
VTEFTTTGIQTYTIGTSGTYDITADGAQGGNSIALTNGGGYGSSVGGDVFLQAGTKLEIVVGGQGADSQQSGGGGGGGSFVIETFNGTSAVDTILAVAGGGGGAGAAENFVGGGRTGPTGGMGAGDSAGFGGTDGKAGHGAPRGGGGGGYTGGSGGNAAPSSHSGAVNGLTFSGGDGGIGTTFGDGGDGGVGGGGGGGAGFDGADGYSGGGGGGGGGYGGGGGGSGADGAGGGGGGSYLDTALLTNTIKTPDINPNNGSVTIEAVCFLRGTRIRTVTGDKAVESLAIGEAVLTARGETRPVRWLGHRAIDCTRHPNPAAVWPIRIQAEAFAPNLPARDLWVSPFHSILVQDVLVHAEKLVNGATIVQVPCERVEYWHVELESHDILLAEGLPAESYLDVGNRTGFLNGGAYLEAHPDFTAKHSADFCMPLVLEGPVVERAKAALLARAQELGCALTEDADVHIVVDGKRVEPISLGEKRLAFLLPASAADIELRCRSFIPAQVNPENTDPRVLGIAIERLQLDGMEIALHDEATFGPGWQALEGDPQGLHWRWCQDRAQLPRGTRIVVIKMCHQGRYWAEPQGHSVAMWG